MEENNNGVLIAIDWENIRRGAQLYNQNVTPASVCDAMRNVAGVFGPFLGGKAFGDWSLRLDDGAAFNQAGIQPYQAPRTMAGKDRSDPAILLEVYDWVRDRDDCGVVILGSGDSDYQVLVDKARERGRRVILCAFSQSVARDMLAIAPLFPLEAELGFQMSEHGDIALVELGPNNIDDAMQIFVKGVDSLERRLSFVGYSKLYSEWMLDWGLANTEYECRGLLDQWLDENIVERHHVENYNNPQFPTAAVRLVRSNEIVREFLGLNRPAVNNPVLPAQSAEAVRAEA